MTLIGTVHQTNGLGTVLTGAAVQVDASLGQIGAVPAGHVGLLARELAYFLTVPLNTGGVQPAGGGPRHDVTNRIGRRSVAEYQGHDPYRLDLNILLNGYPATSVEGTIRSLDTLAARLPRELRMPTVTLSGDQVPLSHRGRKWVLDGEIEWVSDPDPIRVPVLAGSMLVRQALTVHLLEQVTDTLLTDSISRSKRQAKGQKKTPAIYTVKHGQNDFGDVSKTVYGTREQAVLIAQFNRLSVGARLTAGMRIRIP